MRPAMRGWVGGLALVAACPELPPPHTVVVQRVAELPAWAVPPAGEFWRSVPPSAPVAPTPGVEVDLQDIMERASHAVVPHAGGLSVSEAAYEAEWSAGQFTLRAPGGTSAWQMHLRTARIQRGGHEVAEGADAVPAVALGNTVQRLLRDSVVEHWEARTAGVEWTWVFKRPPPGAGELSVEVDVEGLHPCGTRDHGVDLCDASGARNARVAPALAVDADGRRWPVPAEVIATKLRYSLPAAVLEHARYPLALDPIVSPELPVDAPVVSIRDVLLEGPAVAAAQAQYLVVWARGGDILGVRVGLDGALLDAVPLNIGGGTATQQSPCVASNGTDYLVVYRDDSGGTAGVRARRVRGADGAVLDSPDGLPVAATAALEELPRAVASNGSGYLVAWTQNPASGNPRVGMVRRVAADGTFPDAGGGTALSAQYVWTVALASNGQDYLATWYGGGPSNMYVVHALRVSGQDGTLLDPLEGTTLTAPNTAGTLPLPVSNGTDYLVLWKNAGRVVASRLRASDGALVDAAGGFPLLPGSTSNGDFTAFASGADYVALVWDSSSPTPHVALAHVRAADGSLPDGAAGVSLPQPAASARLQVACTPQQCLWVWVTSSSYQARGIRLRRSDQGFLDDAQGVVFDRVINAQTNPAVASNGSTYLVVWSDYRGNQDLRGARLDAVTGALVDGPAGLAIHTGSGDQTNAVAGSNGTDYLVVYNDSATTTTRVARVRGADGVVLDPGGKTLVTGMLSCPPAVASQGQDYLLVWGCTSGGIRATRVRAADGALLDAASGWLALGGSNARGPAAVASDGTDYLVAWDYAPPNRHAPQATRVRALDGAILDAPAFLALGPLASWGTPMVASSDGDYVVAWTGEGGVLGARVLADSGVILRPSPEVLVAQASTAWIAGTDGGYLAVWQQGGSLFAARLSTGSTPGQLTSRGSTLTLGPSATSPRGATASAHGALVVYETRAWGASRVAARLLSFGAAARLLAIPDLAVTAGEHVELPLRAPEATAECSGEYLPPGASVDALGCVFSWTPGDDAVGVHQGVQVAATVEDSVARATFSITVSPSNHPPRLLPVPDQEVVVPQAVTFQVRATDPDGDAVELRAESLPNGAAFDPGTGMFLWTPSAGDAGAHTARFSASDGTARTYLDVSITVRAAPAVLACNAMTLQGVEDGVVVLVPAVEASAGITPVVQLTGAPRHGQVNTASQPWEYSPFPNFHGDDEFTFTATDGERSCGPATVRVRVDAVNDVPVARAGQLAVREDSAGTVVLGAADADGDVLTYEVTAPPAHGTLQGAGPVLTYRPASHFAGADRVVFVARDAESVSLPAEVVISVTPVNHAPEAFDADVEVLAGVDTVLPLVVRDLEGDALTLEILREPRVGALEGTLPALRYRAPPEFRGTDSFTFLVRDGVLASNEAWVHLTVGAPGTVPADAGTTDAQVDGNDAGATVGTGGSAPGPVAPAAAGRIQHTAVALERTGAAAGAEAADAGVPDGAGALPAAQATPGAPPESTVSAPSGSGCGCTAAPRPGVVGMAWLALLGLVCARGRRG